MSFILGEDYFQVLSSQNSNNVFHQLTALPEISF
jgi:hypothetical protein